MKHRLSIAWVSDWSKGWTPHKQWNYKLFHFPVCEYFAHVECQDFAVPDCKENATYVPGKELSSFKHQVSECMKLESINYFLLKWNFSASIFFLSQHHWREGNLPQTSKCAYCKKTCWSSECLTGTSSIRNLSHQIYNSGLGLEKLFLINEKKKNISQNVFRLSMRMVWNDHAWRLPCIYFERLHIRCIAADLFATARRIYTTHRSSDGGHYRCAN